MLCGPGREKINATIPFRTYRLDSSELAKSIGALHDPELVVGDFPPDCCASRRCRQMAEGWLSSASKPLGSLTRFDSLSVLFSPFFAAYRVLVDPCIYCAREHSTKAAATLHHGLSALSDFCHDKAC